uniref:Uncharacterized protein n=1 Tax=Amphilophus citrinellus TaxID=61819 RepID=A0A3Q0R7J4_AMPCI
MLDFIHLPQWDTLIQRLRSVAQYFCRHNASLSVFGTLCSDKIEINLFCLDRVQHVWHEPGDGEAERGGSVIIMGCKSAKGAEEIIFIDGGVKASSHSLGISVGGDGVGGDGVGGDGVGGIFSTKIFMLSIVR